MGQLSLLVAEDFDMSIQICDPDDCQHDCSPNGPNQCSAFWTGAF